MCGGESGRAVEMALIDAYPSFEDDHGADLDGNGVIEGGERLQDFDQDGYVGSRGDYIEYVRLNYQTFSQQVPLFRWGEMLSGIDRIPQLPQSELDAYNMRVGNPTLQQFRVFEETQTTELLSYLQSEGGRSLTLENMRIVQISEYEELIGRVRSDFRDPRVSGQLEDLNPVIVVVPQEVLDEMNGTTGSDGIYLEGTNIFLCSEDQLSNREYLQKLITHETEHMFERYCHDEQATMIEGDRQTVIPYPWLFAEGMAEYHAMQACPSGDLSYPYHVMCMRLLDMELGPGVIREMHITGNMIPLQEHLNAIGGAGTFERFLELADSPVEAYDFLSRVLILNGSRVDPTTIESDPIMAQLIEWTTRETGWDRMEPYTTDYYRPDQPEFSSATPSILYDQETIEEFDRVARNEIDRLRERFGIEMSQEEEHQFIADSFSYLSQNSTERIDEASLRVEIRRRFLLNYRDQMEDSLCPTDVAERNGSRVVNAYRVIIEDRSVSVPLFNETRESHGDTTIRYDRDLNAFVLENRATNTALALFVNEEGGISEILGFRTGRGSTALTRLEFIELLAEGYREGFFYEVGLSRLGLWPEVAARLQRQR